MFWDRSDAKKRKLAKKHKYKAVDLYERSDFDTALLHFKEEERILRQLPIDDKLTLCLNHQGLILKTVGNNAAAMDAFNEEQRISQQIDDYIGLISSLKNQAWILMEGDVTMAEFNTFLSTGHVPEAHVHTLREVEDLKTPFEMWQQVAEISKTYDLSDEEQRAYFYQAMLLYQDGQLDAALVLLDYQESACKGIYSSDLGVGRKFQEHIRNVQRGYIAPESIVYGVPPGVVSPGINAWYDGSSKNQLIRDAAKILQADNDAKHVTSDEAQQVASDDEGDDIPVISYVTHDDGTVDRGRSYSFNQGDLERVPHLQQQIQDLYNERRYGEAITPATELCKLEKKLNGPNSHDYATSLNSLATLYKAMEKYEDAERLYLQILDIYHASVGEQDPLYQISLNHLTALYTAMGE